MKQQKILLVVGLIALACVAGFVLLALYIVNKNNETKRSDQTAAARAARWQPKKTETEIETEIENKNLNENIFSDETKI